MKFHTATHQYSFSWNQVAESFFRRYPNPNSGHVLTEDVLSRHVGKDGCLYTKKLLTKTNKLPWWGVPFVGKHRNAYIIEESIVDPKTKSIVTYSRNVGLLTKVMDVVEKCEYIPAPDAPNASTDCHKQAWISSPVGLVRFGFQRMVRNMHKASLGFEHVLSEHHGGGLKLTETEEQKKGPVVFTSGSIHRLKATAEKAKEGAEKTKQAAKTKATTVLSSSIN